MIRAERALYRALLRFFPPDFRRAFGEAMEGAFEEEREAARALGAAALVALWLRTGVSVAWNGIGERAVGLRAKGGGIRIDGHTWDGRGTMMESVWKELRHAVRRLARRPVWTATAVGTLAIGIGATTAIFSVIEGVVLRPLPYPDHDRLVSIGHVYPGGRSGMPDGGYLHYRNRSQSLADIGLWIEASSAVAGTGEPLEVGIIRTSSSLFSTLGVEPFLGRGFVPEDHSEGAASVAIVSHGFWVRQLGARPDAIGSPLPPDPSTTVIGVMPEDFEFVRPDATVVFGNRFENPDLYYPLQELDPSSARFGNFMYHSIGRLAPGFTVDEAQSELDELMLSAAEAYPGGFTRSELVEGGRRPLVMGLSDAITEDVRSVLWVLLASVGLGMLIALANAASLFIVRAQGRAAEMSIRKALGAGRAAVTTSHAVEAAVLTATACVVGLCAAVPATYGLLSLAPTDLPRGELIGFGPPVVLFSVGVAAVMMTALVLAAGRGGPTDLGSHMREAGRGSGAGNARSRARKGFMSAQVALSLLLLLSSALLSRSFLNLSRVDPGFDATGVLTMRLSLPGSILRAGDFTEGPADRRRADFMLELTSRLEEIPGVEVAAFSADLPLDGDEFRDFVAAEDAWPSDMASALRTLRVPVGPGYLEAIGAEVVSGREFDRQDYADQPRAVVVNETFARQRWPDQDPIGRRVAQFASGVSPDADVFYTVVGVVRDIRESNLMSPPEPTVYLPTVFLPEGNFSSFVSNMVLVVRSSGDPMAVLPRVRETTLAMRPDVPINNIDSLETIVGRSFANVSFATTLLAVTAIASLLLGIVGVYGTISHLVAQTTRELGIRLALGASGRDVSRSVLALGGRSATVGILGGLLVALPTARVLKSWLYDVSPLDPVAYVAVSGTLAIVVVLAALGPARRAARIDPIVAIRSES